MTADLALTNAIVWFYLATVGGVLTGAGALLALLRWGLHKNVGHAWDAWRGWLAMIPILFASILLGRAAVILLLTLVACLAFREYARATGLSGERDMTALALLGIAACGAAALIPDPREGTHGWYGLFISMPVYVIALLFGLPILRNRFEGQLRAITLATAGFLTLGWMFGHLAFLANARHGYGYLLYLLFAVELNDVAAFTCGRLLGRHPLRSQISPRKTWEGALGALAFSLALPWLMRFSLPGFGPLELILTGLIVGVGGQVGDLAISVIKRDVGVKDMGTLIHGHGGLLDRIDSLIVTAPLFFHMLRWFHGLY